MCFDTAEQIEPSPKSMFKHYIRSEVTGLGSWRSSKWNTLVRNKSSQTRL
jgi:hypothetical protein